MRTGERGAGIARLAGGSQSLPSLSCCVASNQPCCKPLAAQRDASSSCRLLQPFLCVPCCRSGRHGRHLALQGPQERAGRGGEVHQAPAAQGAADQHPARVHGESSCCNIRCLPQSICVAGLHEKIWLQANNPRKLVRSLLACSLGVRTAARPSLVLIAAVSCWCWEEDQQGRFAAHCPCCS